MLIKVNKVTSFDDFTLLMILLYKLFKILSSSVVKKSQGIRLTKNRSQVTNRSSSLFLTYIFDMKVPELKF